MTNTVYNYGVCMGEGTYSLQLVDLADVHVPADDGRVSGVTNATLTITDVQTSDAGSYTVVVTDAWGNVTNSVAVLRVVSAPGDLSFRQVAAGLDLPRGEAQAGSGPPTPTALHSHCPAPVPFHL